MEAAWAVTKTKSLLELKNECGLQDRKGYDFFFSWSVNRNFLTICNLTSNIHFIIPFSLY